MQRPEDALSLSVVVCAFTPRRAAQLQAAVGSLRAQARPPDEVIVVVDHAPVLLEWAAAHLEDVTVMPNSGPLGLSAARNCGVAAARGEVVAFLDDDAVAAPDWTERLIAPYADPAVVGVGGAVTPTWEGDRPGWLPEEFQWVVGCSYLGLPERESPVRNLIGCNMSFRRDAIERVGGFTDGIGRIGDRPLGCEETDLCIRIAAEHNEASILYEPAAEVRHLVPRNRATVSYFVARCYAEGLSKAQVVQRSGRQRGLASERAYTRRTLPRGVRAALRHRRFGRAGAIVVGLAVTTAGFAQGAMQR